MSRTPSRSSLRSDLLMTIERSHDSRFERFASQLLFEVNESRDCDWTDAKINCGKRSWPTFTGNLFNDWLAVDFSAQIENHFDQIKKSVTKLQTELVSFSTLSHKRRSNPSDSSTNLKLSLSQNSFVIGQFCGHSHGQRRNDSLDRL